MLKENNWTWELSIDPAKEFGLATFHKGELVDTYSGKVRDLKDPVELWMAVERFLINVPKEDLENTRVLMETGQGFTSKFALRSFGIQEFVVTQLCRLYGVELVKQHCSWLTNYPRRLEKNDINDAIELKEFIYKKEEEES